MATAHTLRRVVVAGGLAFAALTVPTVAALSGSVLPAKLTRRLEVAAENPDVVEMIGIDWALTQIRDLIAHGTPGYHLYLLNRAKSALALAAGLTE